MPNTLIQSLEKAARAEKLAHMFIFHGGSGNERTQTAQRLAQVLNCTAGIAERPCQECVACRKVLSGNHPDVSILKPSKASLGIEEVLDWQGKIYRKHYEGKYKLFFLEEADRLTLPAGNALLKVAEEPPERTVIILSTQNIEGILPTIRSRSQAIYFPPPGYEAWLERLPESDQEAKPEEAFRLSGGSGELAEKILRRGVSSVVTWIDEYRAALERKDFSRLFSLFPIEKAEALVLLEVLAVKLRHEDERKHAKALLEIGKAMMNIEHNATPRLALEVLALRLFR